MDKFYLQLNAVNIITITLMWIVGAVLIGFVSAAVRSKTSGGNSDE